MNRSPAPRAELWQGNLDELSPDRTELLEDLEAAEGGAAPPWGAAAASRARARGARGGRGGSPAFASPKLVQPAPHRLSFGSSMPSTGLKPSSRVLRGDEEEDRVLSSSRPAALAARDMSAGAGAARGNNQVDIAFSSSSSSSFSTATSSASSHSGQLSRQPPSSEGEGEGEGVGGVGAGEEREYGYEEGEEDGDESMDESERLARQLMAEEEAELLERLHQDQTRALEAMHGSGNEGDAALAMRLLREEEEAHRAAQDEATAAASDPDYMSYDELLELGQRIGDVKQERWRIDGRRYVDALTPAPWRPRAGATGQEFPAATCLVCQYDLEEDEMAIQLPCEHVFHADCIKPWLEDHDTCVTCKRSLKDLMVEQRRLSRHTP